MDYMIERLKAMKVRLADIDNILMQGTSDIKTMTKLSKERATLEEPVDMYNKLLRMEQDQSDAFEMMKDSDPEIKEMGKTEFDSLSKQIEKLREDLKIALLPKDENDDKNIIMEIRGGAGGDEAALFAAELYRMYINYAERRGYKTELMSVNETGIGGMKEVVFVVTGKGAYSRLKYEAGVHRVQRVPVTESGGRIHTSTATVAVMPEAEDVDVEINPADVKMEVFRSSGAGGQHINKTSSAVRLIHIPTGMVAECQEERSQLQNREKAMRLLRARLYEIEYNKKHDEAAEAKRSQVGTGDRSEKIRTYNFPQGRVTDHRIGLTLYSIDKVLNGDLDPLLDPIIAADQAAKLAELNQEVI